MSLLDLKIFANDLGFDDCPSNLILDGKVKRFGKKEKRWYIGSIHHTGKGEPFETFTIGDWSTKEQHSYKSKIALSHADKAAYAVVLKQNIQAAEDEKRRNQIQAEMNAKNLWKNATPENIDIHPYMIKKQITGMQLDVRLLSDFDKGDTLLIPTYDINGNMCGLQRIFEDSNKRYMFGQLINETHFTIGNSQLESVSLVYLCEGFATGASIHLATNCPVICCFMASNLPKVATLMIRKYPHLKIIVCGDDDFETKDNVGVKYATEAATLCCTKAVFPIFPERKTGQTDYNDLHVDHGLEAVKAQLCDVTDNDNGFTAMGYDNGSNHYFYNHSSKSIYKISRFATHEFFLLAPLDYWAQLYPKGEKGSVDWDEARSLLIEKSLSVGLYDSTRERGIGVWADDKRYILNTGNGTFLKQKKTDLAELKTRKFYIASESVITCDLNTKLSNDECQKLIKIAKKFKWQEKSSHFLLLGWVALSRCCGSLPVRPNVWITGSKGTGKSTVLNEFIAPLLGSSGYVKTSGNTTEAGLRAMLRRGAMPVIFDEFEVENADSYYKLNSVTQLIRQSFTGESKIFKGTPNGGLIQYTVVFMSLLASIRVSLINDADKSRFCVLELDKQQRGIDDWQKLEKEIYNNINESVGNKLFVRSYLNIDKIIASYEILQKEVASISDQRKGQQYGMLLAGYWSLLSEDVITVDQAKQLIIDSGIGFLDARFNDDLEDTSDEYELLNELFTTKVRIQRSDIGFEEIPIQSCFTPETERAYYHHELLKYGLKYNPRNHTVFIPNQHREIKKLLSDTKWTHDWSKTFLRLPASKKYRDRITKSANPVHGVLIDLSAVFAKSMADISLENKNISENNPEKNNFDIEV